MAGDSTDTKMSGPIVESGSRVVLVVSRGPRPGPRSGSASVPGLLGMAQGAALQRVQSAGLNVQVFTELNDSVKRGDVIDQFPPAGASVGVDSQVVVLVSAGPSAHAGPASLPDVVGLPEADATEAARTAGLQPEVVRDYHPNVAEGVVVAQLPAQATIAAEKPRRSWVMWTWVAVGLVLAALVAIAAFALIIGKQVTVPTITGLTLPQAQNVVTAAGLKIGDITTQAGSNAPEGSIIAQTPQPGVDVREGSSLTIVIAAFRPKANVPSVVGLSTAEAQRTIASAGLVSQIARKYSDSTPQDTIIDQSPAAGQSVLLGSSVMISISIGPQSTTVTLPNVVGMTQSDAVSKIVSLGLTSHVSNSLSSTGTAGQVIDEFPAAGRQVAPGTAIGLNVSAGPPTGNTVTVPDLVGQTSTNAIATLGGLGLTYSTVMWDGTGSAAQTVVSQSPPANDQVASGGSVVVFVSSGK